MAAYGEFLGKWIKIVALYLVYFIPDHKKEFHWYFVIFISLMIHLYFTVIVFVIYLFFLLEKILDKINIKLEIRNLIFIITFIILVFSETSLRYSTSSNFAMIVYLVLPWILFLISYLIFNNYC